LRRFTALFALLAAVLVLGAVPAGAITGNYTDDTIHPYVGLIAFYDKNDVFTHRCSGSLLTPTVFLTAGHCTDATTGATHARIWFQQDAGVGFDGTNPAPSGYPVSSDVTSSHLYNYGYPFGFPDTHDVGIVILDTPIAVGDEGFVGGFASLASVGSLDRLATKRGQQVVTFTASGYGLSLSNPVKTVSFRKRLMATEQLINLRSMRRRLRRTAALRLHEHHRCRELLRPEPVVPRQRLHVPGRPGCGAGMDSRDDRRGPVEPRARRESLGRSPPRRRAAPTPPGPLAVSWQALRVVRVAIEPYSERWARDFARLARRLRSVLGEHALRIDHIGSTAVPGLAAKDRIDVQVAVADLADANPLGGAAFVELGPVEDHRPPGSDTGSDDWQKRFFQTDEGERRGNVHVRVEGRANHRYALLFRDYLREHSAAAAA
jgi:GrpB-like predicted nucleotidyltransferase (UPF0157 family)